jgi:hypothetical protein
MSLAQLAGLTGKKIAPGYVPQINAQTPYLGQIYGQKKEQQYLDASNQIATDRLALAKKEQEQNDKYQKKAQRLGYLNVGLNTGLGLADLASSFNWGQPVSDTAGAMQVSDAMDILNATGGNSASGESSPVSTALTSSGGGDILKNVGTGILDFGKGIYDNTIGKIIDLF